MLKYPPEEEYGNVEYKRLLVDKSPDRIITLATQMRYRTTEGNGESIYVIGVSDNGDIVGVDDYEFTESFNNLSLAADKNCYSITMLSSKDFVEKKKVYEILIREKNEQKYIDIKVAVAGNVDAGKCHGKGTRVKLYSGNFKNVEDITTKDILMGDDSTPRNVLNTSNGFGQLYSIIPDYGDNLNINKNHIICFKYCNNNSIYWDNILEIYVVKYVMYDNLLPKLKTNYFPSSRFIMDTYGCDEEAHYSANTFLDSLKSNKDYIKYGDIIELNIQQYLNLAESIRSFLKLYKVPVIYPLQEIIFDPYLLGNGLCKFPNKYLIPNVYKYNTREVRLKIIAGIIDSDGIKSEEGGYEFNMTIYSEKLCDDIIEVIRSLGFTSYKTYTDKSTRINFRIDGEGIEEIPVKLQSSNSSNSVLFIGIKDIKILPYQKYYGFELDGNSRYLLDDFTVTHNSSLLGVLTSGKNDDGRGSARLSIFNFKHEVSSGRTSSIAHHILGFDDKGCVMNYSGMHKKGWPEIIKGSSKVISFYDLCGHEKYLRTTILGLTSSFPDLCMILVGSNMGITRMTREHIFLCVTMKIPFAIVMTKIDICLNRKNVLKDTVKSVNKLLKLPGLRRIPYKVNSVDDVIICAKNVRSESIVPIFHVSNVTGYGIDNLKQFLNLLGKVRSNINDDVKEAVMHIDTTFTVAGIGTVIGGQLISGTIKIGDKMMLGPNNGIYTETQVKSIHCKRVTMQEVKYGSYVCLGIKKIDRKSIRRGNVIISKGSPEISAYEFEAEITVLKSHSTTIKTGYEPVIHTCTMRQAAKLISIVDKVNGRNINVDNEKDCILRTGDKATARFRFSHKSEYLKIGDRLLMAEDRVKIVGVVTAVGVNLI
jgi:GTPase